MKRHSNMRVALAATAAIVGAGFASGREIMTFFSSMGWVSWLGVVAACVGIGFLSGMLSRFAVRTGAQSFPAIYGATMGRVYEDSIHGLYGLLMLLTASAMLAAGAELGALALPVKYAMGIGMALTLLASAGAAYVRRTVLSILGAVLVPMVVIYYCAMAVDGRPAPITFPTHTSWVMGSAPLALILGLLYGALNVTMAGGVICLNCDASVTPKKVGLYTGVMMGGMLIPANLTFLMAGPELRGLALPSVVLAARWGMVGYYGSIIVLWSAVITTLCAAISSMQEQMVSLGVRPLAGIIIICVSSILLALVGFGPLVDIGYPVLGWTCSIALLALIVFL